MNAKFAIAFLTILLSSSVKAQDQRILDSLKSVIETAEHDTSICNAYLNWGEQVYISNPDTALILFQLARKTAEQNLETDAKDVQTSLEKKYLFFLADALNNIAYIYQCQGNIKNGLEYNHMSLTIRERIGDKNGIATSLNNLGAMYDNQEDISKGLEYYHRGLKIRKEIGDISGVANSLNNIGYIYIKKGDLTKALEYYHRSLKIKKEIGDLRGESMSLNNIGTIYDDQDDNEKAVEYILRSLEIREEIGDKDGVAVCLNNLGSMYLEMKDEAKATEYTTRSLEMAMELGYPRLIRSPAIRLSAIFKRAGNFEQALEMYELYIVMRDSINNENTQKATIRQQTKYEFEKAQLVKEQEEKEKARIEAEVTGRRDNLQYSVILIALLVLFGGVMSLGFVKVSSRMAEGIIFFSFLILFEFLLVLADPYIEGWSGGAPGIKLLFNAGIAALIFPAHAFFEARLKGKLVKK